MTIAVTPVGLQAAHDVCWRLLDGGLWVARRDGRHLGSVQPGRRWLATDAEGEPIGAFRSFREAQAAVADPDASSIPVRRAAGPGLAIAALVTAAAVPAIGWGWTAFLL